jgi:putative spermidine/putrescine transport system permease protein
MRERIGGEGHAWDERIDRASRASHPALSPAGGGIARRGIIGGLVVGVLLAFMTLPSLVVIGVSVNPTAIMSFPPAALSVRWYVNALTYPQFQRAAVNSLWVTLGAALIALPIGTAAALALERGRLRGRAVWTTILLSPLVVPGVAAGLGFLIVAASLGLLRSRVPLITAHVALVLPFVVRSVWVSVKNLDPALERAAASLGATPWRTFRRVTLPLLRPGLFASLLFALVVSVNEFVVSLFISTRVTEILPVAMFTYVVNYTDPTIAALSSLFITATFVAVWMTDRFFGLARVFLFDR